MKPEWRRVPTEWNEHGRRLFICSGCGKEWLAQEGDVLPICSCTSKSPEGTKATNPKDAIGCRKAPMSVVPANVVAEIGLGMLEGTCKYGRHNYRAMGVRSSIYYDATMRHMMSWWEGEDIDPDSGLSHVTKAIASLVVLRDAMMNNMLTDDRPPSSIPFFDGLNKQAEAIIDRHADKHPHHYTREDSK